jgi:superkiller protein 3
MYLSLSYEQLGDQEAAIRAMQSAFDIAPRNRAFERYLVSMLRKSGQNAEAEEVLRQHLEVYPDDDAAKVELARTMRAEGRTEEAIAAMEAVVAQSPDNLDARLELGESLKTGGRSDEAAAAFRGAAEAHPDSAVAHHAWGVTELASGNFQASLKPLQDAARLDEENGSYRFALAQAYESLDKIPESLGEYEAFLRLSPDDPLAPKIGQLVKRAKAALAERQAQGRSGGNSGN